MTTTTLSLLALAVFAGALASVLMMRKVRWWRFRRVESQAFGRWSRLSLAQKHQALKKIGVFLLNPAAVSDSASVETLDGLFLGILGAGREAMAAQVGFDLVLLEEELAMALEPASDLRRVRLANA